MKQLSISIPDMQSTHCQSRVNTAVQEIEGVHIQHLASGTLTVAFSQESREAEVVNAIEKAGYRTSTEQDDTSSDCSTGCCNS